MDYNSWKNAIISKLSSNGFDSVLVIKVFDEAEIEMKSAFEKNDFTLAGAYFVQQLEKYDLDLEVGRERGKGRVKTDLATSYKMTTEEVHARARRGFMKKSMILGWFRGEDLDPTPSFNF